MARVGPELAEELTPREREVLDLLRLGLTNSEIARRLDISADGAKYHVSEIITKLGVRNRYEASAWPQRPPWWLGAVAPIGLFVRELRGSAIAMVLTGAAAVAVAAAIGVLAWGIVRTDGGDEPNANVSGGNTPAALSPTSTPNLLPLETPEPYTGAAIDCPGGFATPEEAIEACYELPEGHIFIGDCDTPTEAPTGGGLDRPCTVWEDSSGDLRSYQVTGIGVDGYQRYTVEQRDDGWVAIQRSICSVQHIIDDRSTRELQGLDISQVFVDECGYAPPPMPRPTRHLGSRWEARSVGNGRTDLTASGAGYFPGRGIKLSLFVHNISGETLPWTSDVGAPIELVAEDGTSYAPSEVGGTLARSIAAGMPPDASWHGWLVFPVEEFGTYTLRYPGQPDLALDLTPEAYRAPLPDPKEQTN